MRYGQRARTTIAVFVLSCLTLVGPFSGSTAFAQDPNGRLIVTVKDPSDAVIAAATVTVTSVGTGERQVVNTNESGVASFPRLAPGDYQVAVEAAGFQTQIYEMVKIDVSREYPLIASLDPGLAGETVTVTAGESLVTTTNAEISNTVSPKQVEDLPLDGRNPLQLIQLQAGVTIDNGRGGVTINGQRTSSSTITQDGITVQDYAVRDNALTFSPNRTSVSQVAEFTVTTQNGGADVSGSSAIQLVTPSGTNELHGQVFEYHRNDAFGANDFFNNANGIERPQLIRNQFGFTLGGPVYVPRVYDGRNDMFFFGAYEGFRERSATPFTGTVLTPEARQGIFRYLDVNTGQIRTVNLFSLSNFGVDPVASSLIGRIPLPNSNLVGDQLVTSGFSFNKSTPTDRNQGSARLDYNLNERHSFEAVYQYTGEMNARQDIDTSFNQIPLGFDSTSTHFGVVAWKWSVSDVFTNEVRAGVNNSTALFGNDEDVSDIGYYVIFPLTTDPQSIFDDQLRRTVVSSLIDNASYIRGNHFFRFGGRIDVGRLRNTKSFFLTPQVTIGLGAGTPADISLSLGELPGANATDVARANALIATLGGFITSATREYNINDVSNPLFTPDQAIRNNHFEQYSLYAADQWRIHPQVTLNLGLRYDYTTPLREKDNLAVLPVTPGIAGILDPNGAVDVINGGYYNPDRNNFAPNLGVAWDVFGDGTTTVRGGFSLAFVNDETVRAVQVLGETNSGLNATVATSTGFFGSLNDNAGAVLGGLLAPPEFELPLSFAGIRAQNPAPFIAGVNPDLQTPYYQQWNVSVEREIGWDTAVSARYVGNRGRKLFGNINYNQIDVIGTGFAADVLRAQQNGFLSLERNGVFNPAFNPDIPGSQQLTVFPNLVAGGVFGAAIVQQYIAQGRAGDLANLYFANGLEGSVAFVPNPNGYFNLVLDNSAYSTYNAAQLEVRRRFTKSLGFQANYTWSKAYGFGAGTGQLRQDFPEDLNDLDRDRRRLLWDTTHNFKANVVYGLPFGDGQWLDPENGILEALVGGWEATSIVSWYSGAPISINTSYGTFTPGGSQVNSTLSTEEVRDLFGIFRTEDGIFYVNPSVIGPNGAAAAPAGQDPFPGQVFFNPGPGEKGSLQLLQFNGPTVFNWDASLIKNIALTEQAALQLRFEFFNVLNQPIFFITSQDINSVNFGRVNQTLNDPRVVQFAAKVTF